MSKLEVRMGLLVLIIFFLFLGRSYLKENSKYGSSDGSYAVAKSFFAFQEALAKGDYESAWGLMANNARIKFGDNFDFFKTHYKNKQVKSDISDQDIKEIKFFTNDIATLVLADVFNSVYMSRENGMWKFSGKITSNIYYVNADIRRLAKAIDCYRDSYGDFPSALIHLIPNFIKELPIDFFNPKGNPYTYVNRGSYYEIYSFGPDMDNDKGLISYDIATGILSDGDIVYDSSSPSKVFKKHNRKSKKR